MGTKAVAIASAIGFAAAGVAACGRTIPVGDLVAPSGDAGTDAGDGGVETCTEAPVDVFDPLGTCARDEDCEAGICRRDATPPEDGSVVTLACNPPAAGMPEGATCASDTDCGRGLCVVAGRCVAPCRDREDCPSSESCEVVRVRASGDITQQVRACVPRIALPADIAIDVEDDSLLAETAEDGTIATDVALPGGAALFVLETGCAEALRAVRLRSMMPELVYFDGDELRVGAPAPRNTINAEARPLTAWIPNGPTAPTAESYLLGVAPRPVTPTLTTLRGTRRGGALDIDAFVVGARFQGSSGSPEEDAEALAQIFARVEEILGPAGIRIGEVRHHPVTGELAERLRILDREEGSFPERRELMRLTLGIAEPSVPVFFVRSIDQLLGLSGGVPGPWGILGTEGSGVVMSTEVIEMSGLDLGRVAAHEIAHYLGLFHPSELDGLEVDPLPDTPVCSLDQDADGDGFASADECAGFGADNLMFWSGQATGTELTPGQQMVLSRALVLKR